MIQSHELPTPCANALTRGLRTRWKLGAEEMGRLIAGGALYRYRPGIAFVRFIRPGNVRALKRFGILFVGLGCLAYLIFTAMGGQL